MLEGVDGLIELSRSKSVREFSGDDRLIYKWYLAGVLKDILIQGNYARGVSFHQLVWLYRTRKYTKGPLTNKNHNYIQINEIKEALIANYFCVGMSPDNLIDFLRIVLDNMKNKNKTLHMVSEFDGVFDVKKYFEIQNRIIIKDHHWIDITFYNSVIHTIPEFINFTDLLVLWNEYTNMRVEYIELTKEDEFFNKPRSRELRAGMSTLSRGLIIYGVSFVESYLYYYFYNLKNNPNKNKKPEIIGVLKNEGKSIQDTQIIEKIIFKLHGNIKSHFICEQLYKEYKNINNLRNRFTHSSAFVDRSNQITQLQPLINLEHKDLKKMLQVCIDFIQLIEHHLPNDEKVIQWWDRFESPVFSLDKKVSILNKFR